jgi:sortase A
MKAENKWRSVPPKRTHPFLRWSGYLLCLMGILALSYCGYVLLEARLYQAYQSWRFEGALKSSKPPASSGELPPSPAPPAPPEATLTPAESRAIPGPGGVLLGRIEISRIGFAAMVMEGIDNRTLRHAVGHIPGTALPGLQGNVGIAGHRDTFFRGLQYIRKEDEITLTTLHGSYRYRVDSTLVVEPREIWVLEDTGDATLTLVTCYPFNYVGPAPLRFIVRARKISG